MFTGIVQGLGLLKQQWRSTLKVEIPSDLRDRLVLGGSVAINGVCLTVHELTSEAFLADLSQETASRTTLGRLQAHTRVNLELPVAPEGSLDGHIVLGHVDTVGRVKAIVHEREGRNFTFSYPPEFSRYMVEKGTVAVDGISLTPFQTTGGTFRCAIIPKTFKATNLQDLSVGDPVNIEFDILAKYTERMIRRVH